MACLFVVVLALVLWAPNLLADVARQDKSQALLEARGYVLQVMPTIVLLGGLVMTLVTYLFNRSAKRADRFEAAVELVGKSESAAARCGGIYALRAIAVEDVSYQSTVEQVLSAFVREHLPIAKRDGKSDVQTFANVVDVQAAVNVLGDFPRREQRDDWVALDFSGIDFRGIDLSSGNFGRMNFDRADLRGVDLSNSTLARASFHGAQMQGANLAGARAWNADFSDATLLHAKFESTDVRGADVSDAELEGSTIRKARNFGQIENVGKVKSLPADDIPDSIPVPRR